MCAAKAVITTASAAFAFAINPSTGSLRSTVPARLAQSLLLQRSSIELSLGHRLVVTRLDFIKGLAPLLFEFILLAPGQSSGHWPVSLVKLVTRSRKSQRADEQTVRKALALSCSLASANNHCMHITCPRCKAHTYTLALRIECNTLILPFALSLVDAKIRLLDVEYRLKRWSSQSSDHITPAQRLAVYFPAPCLHGSRSAAFSSALLQQPAQPSTKRPSPPFDPHTPQASTIWRPQSINVTQAESQLKRIAQFAEAQKALKQPKAYHWPAMQRGMSDMQAQQVASRSLSSTINERLKSDTLAATLDKPLHKFNRVPLGKVQFNEQFTHIQEPAHLESDVGVKDENGQAISWPWRGGARPILQNRTSSRSVRVRHKLDDLIELALNHASADKQSGSTHTGVRAWFSFCEDVMGVPADRPLDPQSTPLWEKLEDEWLAMRFVCALVQDRGISPTSAYQYFCAVQGWHARKHGVKLCAGLKLERLPQMLKGLRRITGEQPRRKRRGISPQQLRRGMDLLFDPSVPAHANIRAALAVALQGLLRSAEFSTKGGTFDIDRTIRRSDIDTIDKSKLVLMIAPCKNMHHLSGRTCPLVLGAGGSFIDAVAEVNNLLSIDAVHPRQSASTPMFRDPMTNKPLSYEFVLQVIKRIMLAIGEDPAHFGTHSLRIGGATALFAAGANETVIRTMGRWSSDIHRIYVRACFEQCCSWSAKAGSAIVSDLAAEFDEVDNY